MSIPTGCDTPSPALFADPVRRCPIRRSGGVRFAGPAGVRIAGAAGVRDARLRSSAARVRQAAPTNQPTVSGRADTWCFGIP
ncbi:hypothetical protein A5789_26460 [Nocardia sp. 852002-51101_SCH5132738]|nr:hypothetical protein A5789_26460 [Nocardia sp. 852002-51101_SCH5132738]